MYYLERKDHRSEKLKGYVIDYIMRIFEQLITAYESLTPIQELYNKEWVNFIEAVTSESLHILNLILQSESSFLIDIMNT